MAKSLLVVLALVFAASAAEAGPTFETNRNAVVSRQHDYWLSNGLSRLAFWQGAATRQNATRH